MRIYILVFIFQVFFNIFKTLEIKYTYEHKVRALLFNSVLINLASLATSYLSLERLFHGDWLVIIAYTAGSVLGKWIAMEKVEDYRRIVYEFLNRNK